MGDTIAEPDRSRGPWFELVDDVSAPSSLARRLEFAEMLLDGGRVQVAGIPWREAWERMQKLTESAASKPRVSFKMIPITPAEAFDLLTLVAQVDDRTPIQQATIDRLAVALEARR